MERFTATWFNNHLVQEWIPAMPDVKAALEAGCTLADVGCGGGRALITLAGTSTAIALQLDTQLAQVSYVPASLQYHIDRFKRRVVEFNRSCERV